jgi:hypothetical protein
VKQQLSAIGSRLGKPSLARFWLGNTDDDCFVLLMGPRVWFARADGFFVCREPGAIFKNPA